MATPLLDLCWNEAVDTVDVCLHRDYFGLHSIEDDESVNFQLPYASWIKLFRRSGLVIEDLIELRPAEDAVTTYPDFVSKTWARRWPAEHIWKLRKCGLATAVE